MFKVKRSPFHLCAKKYLLFKFPNSLYDCIFQELGMFGLKDGKENEEKYTLADKCILSLLQVHHYFYKETVYQKIN